jgi:hypothetical protein
MDDDRPIGMFDSGFGGLTVARAVIDLLPAEHLVYLGDTGRYPYGSKPLGEVARYARQIATDTENADNARAYVGSPSTGTVFVVDIAGGVVLFTLHAGAEVNVRERVGAQALIALPDDRVGWVPLHTLGLVDPRLPFPSPPAKPAG